MEKISMTYHKNEFFANNEFIPKIVNNIAKLGLEVEKIYGTAQDIEGVICKDNYYIVQTRPQV